MMVGVWTTFYAVSAILLHRSDASVSSRYLMSSMKSTAAFAPLDFLFSPRNKIMGSRTCIAAQESPKPRVPWEFGRFVRQSAEFLELPPLFRGPDNGGIRIVLPGDSLWQPLTSSDDTIPLLFEWRPLDDVVMGGASSSSFENKSGTWKGFVTDANSGGFIGIRTTPLSRPPSARSRKSLSALDMSKCKGIRLRLRGGMGRRIKATVRDSTAYNGVAWTSSLDCTSENNPNIYEVQLPFDAQIPTIFAKTVPNQTFNAANIVGFQLTYSKFEYDGDLNPKFLLGDFTLQVVEIQAY